MNAHSSITHLGYARKLIVDTYERSRRWQACSLRDGDLRHLHG